MKTRKFILTAALMAGLAMTGTTLTACSSNDNPVDDGSVPSIGVGSMTDGKWGYKITINDVMLTGYTGSDKETLTTLDIPLKVGGQYLTYIPTGEFDFREFKKLETLNFDMDCRIKDMPTMRWCSALQHVNSGKETDKLPAGMKTVPSYVFRNTAIKNIDFNNVESVGHAVFAECESLENVNILNPDVSLADDAFALIRSKCTVTLKCSMEKLGWRHVAWSPQLIVVCNDGAIGWCGDSREPTQEDFLYWMYDYYGFTLTVACAQLGIDNFPDKQIIKTHRWHDYAPKTRTVILKDVYAIGKESFKGLTDLQTLTLNDGLAIIGESAFEDCSYLTTITIPASVTSIASKAFAGCTKLTEVTIMGNPTIADDAFPEGVYVHH